MDCCHSLLATEFYRSESKLASLKERLASEIDPAASTLPTILADCQDDEAVERMVAQAKVSSESIDNRAFAVLGTSCSSVLKKREV